MATRPIAYTPTASQDISRPYFTQKVKLNSLHAHQVFDRGFELCANAIFSLSILLRVFATEAQAREVEAIVDNRLNKVFEDIRTEGTRLEKLAESNGIEFSGVTYSNPKELEAKITSPRAVQYVGLIREFDSLVANPPCQNSCRLLMMLDLGAIRMRDGTVRRSVSESSGGADVGAGERRYWRVIERSWGFGADIGTMA